MPFSCGIGAHALQEEGYFIITRNSRSKQRRKKHFMAFFNSAVGVLQTLVIALGAGLGIWLIFRKSGISPCIMNWSWVRWETGRRRFF